MQYSVLVVLGHYSLHGRMAALNAKTRQALAVANQRQKQFMHRREVEYRVGDKVWLSTKNIVALYLVCADWDIKLFDLYLYVTSALFS
jgi:hypothetical protein